MAAHESGGMSPQRGSATRAEWLGILKDKKKMSQEAANEWLASQDASFFKSQEGLEFFREQQIASSSQALSPIETPVNGWPTRVILDTGSASAADANLGGGAGELG